jgi:hypothetical protein
MVRFMVYYTEYTECQAFCPVVRIGSPPTPHPLASVYPPRVQGRDTFACGGWGGGTKFRRRDMYTIIPLPYTIYITNICSYKCYSEFTQLFQQKHSDFIIDFSYSSSFCKKKHTLSVDSNIKSRRRNIDKYE